MALSSYSFAAHAVVRAVLMSVRICSAVLVLHAVPEPVPVAATVVSTASGLLTRPVVP